MGKFLKFAYYYLGCFYLAAFAVPALGSKLSVDVSPTTGYTVTNRTTTALPPRTTSGPVANYNPTLGPLSGGGAYQTTSSGITITGISGNVGSTTMAGRMSATASAMRNGVARCFTSMRCNMALMAGGAGIEALLSGIDWIIEEGSGVPVIREKGINDPSLIYPPPVDTQGLRPVYPRAQSGGGAQCKNNYTNRGELVVERYGVDGCYSCHLIHNNLGVFYGYSGGNCWHGDPSSAPPIDPDWARVSSGPPLSFNDIEKGIENNYLPDPSDLPFLTGGFDWGHPGINFEVVDIPAITGQGSGTFIENSDGTSQGTYSEFEFSWTPGPSKQPSIDVNETETTTHYGPNGEITGSTTTTTVISGSSATADIEVPTDCDFMPTVCRFIDWFTQSDPELSQEPDLSQLIDTVDIERDYSVGSSSASCPAPLTIDLKIVPSVQVSLQSFCDFADLLRPFLLTLCFLFSGMIILRT